MTDTEYTKGFKAGLAWEQERIIKLLETEQAWDIAADHSASGTLEHLIKLINGETK